MFAETLRSVPDVSLWDVSNVTDMSYMFSKASMADPIVTSWNVSNVTNMRNMFTSAQVANVDMQNWDFSSISVELDEFILGSKMTPENYGQLLIRLAASIPRTAKWYSLNSGTLPYPRFARLSEESIN